MQVYRLGACLGAHSARGDPRPRFTTPLMTYEQPGRESIHDPFIIGTYRCRIDIVFLSLKLEQELRVVMVGAISRFPQCDEMGKQDGACCPKCERLVSIFYFSVSSEILRRLYLSIEIVS